MAYTPFGEFVRILRIKHHQVMGDMAKILGTSTPFLSAVENGKNQRRAALQFARSFDEMDDETALKILELLRNKEDID